MGKVWNKPQVRIGNSTDLEHLGLITTPKTWGLYTGGGQVPHWYQPETKQKADIQLR